jgi:2-keto-3-deoxy-L-rhamnonate aldolase RhmA
MKWRQLISVEGIDACDIGPCDLSRSLMLGIRPNWKFPRYLAAFDKVTAAAKRHEKTYGMFATLENIEWALGKGMTFNSVDDADVFLVRGAKMALNKARDWHK